jgi:Mg2+-importing ATPase
MISKEIDTPAVAESADIESRTITPRRSQAFFTTLIPFMKKKKALHDELSEREKDTLTGLIGWSQRSIENALQLLETTSEGLVTSEARKLRDKVGYNELSNTKPPAWWWLLLSALPNPFNLLLIVLAVVAIATGDYATFSILLVMVALSVGLRFIQELKSSRRAASLKELVKSECEVLRRDTVDQQPGSVMAIHCKEVVPGDIVLLTTGSVVPADCLLLESNMFTVSQSSLTGENLPIEKTPMPMGDLESKNLRAFDVANILFTGSYVVSGSGKALVLTTGDRTYVATMSAVFSQGKPITAFQTGIRRVSILLIGFMAVMVPIVLVIEGLVSHDWEAAGLFCIAVAVGLVPEMMPMVVNANLARGSIIMAKKKVIVKRLDAIQNIGSVDVLCSDKTGTLTEDGMKVAAFVNAAGESDTHVLDLAYLNASLQTGLKNPLDRAIVDMATREDHKDRLTHNAESWTKVAEIPFDFVRRMLSVVVAGTTEKNMLICKGAAEEMLQKCSGMRVGGNVISIDQTIRELAEGLNKQGYRVIGVATRNLAYYAAHTNRPSPLDEVDLTFEGFVAFQDPPKVDAGPAIAELASLGVETKVLTGDTLITAIKVCSDIGILQGEDAEKQVISGADLELLEPAEFDKAVQRCKVFAKLTPIQKYQVVRSLKENGRRVAFLGDGINDAAALRGADCGISVNSGTDIAKDAADVILTEKSLGVIVDAVRIGRITFVNTLKYIKMAASSNFGNVFSVVVASAWLPFTPMLPIQLLTQNLAYDISQSTIPWDNVDAEMIQQPRPWEIGSLARFMVILGPTSSVFDICTFAINWFYFGIRGHSSEKAINTFRTHWFLEGLLSQTLIVHLLRSHKFPFIQTRASKLVILTTLSIAIIGIAIPYSPLGKVEGMEWPYPMFYPFLVVILICYAALVQVVKMAYIRIFKEWL